MDAASTWARMVEEIEREVMGDFIVIKKSETADTRACDFASVSKQQLLDSSEMHIDDVRQGMEFFKAMLDAAAFNHDSDKITAIDQFHADFVTGFKQTGWWDSHRKISRHHLQSEDAVPDDVNLVDVLEMVIDCVMAGMGRKGEVYPISISPEILADAVNNTANLLKSHIIVEKI